MSRCVLCSREMPDELQDAIDTGWEPSVYDADDEIPGPVCPVCVQIVCRVGADGETELTR